MLVEGIDYVVDEKGLVVLTSKYLKDRGKCCGNKCKNCCYVPIHTKGNTNIKNTDT